MAISKIKRIRFELELSQQQLARRLGVSQSLVSRLEKGERKLTQDSASKLSRIFADTEELNNGRKITKAAASSGDS